MVFGKFFRGLARKKFNALMMASYRTYLERGASKPEALGRAIIVCTDKPLLEHLTDDDLGYIAVLFASLPRPLCVADLLLAASDQEDPTMLNDREYLLRVIQVNAEAQSSLPPSPRIYHSLVIPPR